MVSVRSKINKEKKDRGRQTSGRFKVEIDFLIPSVMDLEELGLRIKILILSCSCCWELMLTTSGGVE